MLSSEFAPFPNFLKCPSSVRLCSPALPPPKEPLKAWSGLLVWGKSEKAAQVLVLVGQLFPTTWSPAEVLLPCFPDLTFQNAFLPQTGDEERVPGKGVEDRGREEV